MEGDTEVFESYLNTLREHNPCSFLTAAKSSERSGLRKLLATTPYRRSGGEYFYCLVVYCLVVCNRSTYLHPLGSFSHKRSISLGAVGSSRYDSRSWAVLWLSQKSRSPGARRRSYRKHGSLRVASRVSNACRLSGANGLPR